MERLFFVIVAIILIALLLFVIGHLLEFLFSISITGFPNLDSVIVLAIVALIVIIIHKGTNKVLSVSQGIKIPKDFLFGIVDRIFVLGIILLIILWLFQR